MVVKLVAWLGLASVWTAATAAAEEPPPPPITGPTETPAGDDWRCYDLLHDGTHHTGCHRSGSACRHMGRFLAGRFGLATPTCAARPTAAVFTFFNVAAKRTEYRAFVAMAECEQARLLQKPPASRAVSPCVVVGKSDGSPFEAAVIPAGRRWWCATTVSAAAVSTAWCKRTRAACRANASTLTAGGGKITSACRRADAAYATTWAEAGETRYLVAPTLAACQDVTDYVTGSSRCTRVP